MPKIFLYTLDVGHGLCQIIKLPERRAVVIDGGDTFATHVVTEFLHRHVDEIVAYVATHNHRDHVGAANSFLRKYGSADKLQLAYLAIDRGSTSEIQILTYLLDRQDSGTLGDLRVCGVTDGEPRRIPLGLGDQVRLEFFYPAAKHWTPLARLLRRKYRAENRASACLRLTVGRCRALITGDIDLVGLSEIVDEYGLSIQSNVLTVPHHGGKIPGGRRGRRRKKCRSWQAIVDEIKPECALISCGTGATALDSDTITPLVEAGAYPICTELTDTCCSDARGFHPGILPPRPGTPQLSGSAWKPQAVACMGSIVTVFDGIRFRIRRFDEHQAALARHLEPHGLLKCRRALLVEANAR